MVFGLFSKSKEQVNVGEAADESQDANLNPPSPLSVSAEIVPPQSPNSTGDGTISRPLKRSRSPSQDHKTSEGQQEDSKLPGNPIELLKRIKTIPPKVIRDYLVTRIPKAPPNESDALVSFFVDLAPPPKIHCVRCHQDYVEVENSDRSCHVPHDDESAVVEHVGNIRNKGSTYETLWGCCNKVVEGDGDQGPPDGWCYEGFHTTDIKRARFRADSSVSDDKLIPCTRLRCFNAGAIDGTRGRSQRAAARKNFREESDEEEYDERELVREAQALACDSDAGTSASAKKRVGPRGRKKAGDTPLNKKTDNDASSTLSLTPNSNTRRKSEVEGIKPKSKSRISEVKEISSTLGHSTTDTGAVGEIDMDMDALPALEVQDLTKTSADSEQKQKQKQPRKPRKSAGTDGAKYIPPKDEDKMSDVSMEDERPKRKKARRRKSAVANEDAKT